MKTFYSGLISAAQDGVGTTDATIKTFLTRRINSRYEIATSKLNTWTQSTTRTFTTGTSAAADQQFYANPPNLREIESIVLNDGSFDYPLTTVYAQQEWDALNTQIVTGSWPERFFRRNVDFGIWPTPNANDYTGTITFTQRATPLYFANYVTGTVAVTENDQTVTVTTGVTTTFKPGFWFCLADANGEPRGSFYEITSITDSANFELTTFFEESTETGVKYIVGQIPNLPEEIHLSVAEGAISDFYGMKTKDTAAATRFDNKFWTGSYSISPLQAKGMDGAELGGILGAIKSYADRDSSVVVNRRSGVRDIFDFQIPRTFSV